VSTLGAISALGIARYIETPSWAKHRAGENAQRLAGLFRAGFAPSVNMVASIDWRSLCHTGESEAAIKLDWSLVEFIQLADLLSSGALDGAQTVGVFDDILLGAEFKRYKAAETILIGELARLLCWRSIQQDNLPAVAFFYRRFMDYCGSNQSAISAYLAQAQHETFRRPGIIDFLVGHEFSHLSLAKPSWLSVEGLALARYRNFNFAGVNREHFDLVAGDIPWEIYRSFVGRGLTSPYIEELRCDCLGFWYSMTAAADPMAVEEVCQRLEDYGRTIHVAGWIAVLEAALFAEGPEDRGDTFAALADFQSVRSHFLIHRLIQDMGNLVLEAAPAALPRLMAARASVRDFVKWLDRALALHLEKMVMWRFEIEDLRRESFWLSDRKSAMIDHLRRYPEFHAADYTAANAISRAVTRGWSYTED
jgi:hypothetical protein